MRNARCSLDEGVYTASEFSKQSMAWRQDRKGTLVCVECDRPAHYRKKTTKGHAPCFVATHTPDCAQRSSVHETQESEGVAVVPTIDNEGGIVQLRLDGLVLQPAGPYHRAVDDYPDPNGVLRHVRGADGEEQRRGNQATMGLRSLLGHLVNDPQYAQTDERMRVPDRGEVPLKDLVKAFRDVTGDDRGRTLVVWGPVVSTKEEHPGPTYLNTGRMGQNPCPIKLSPQRATEALEALGWENFHDLWGGHAIVFGKIEHMYQDRYYIEPEVIDRIAVRTP